MDAAAAKVPSSVSIGGWSCLPCASQQRDASAKKNRVKMQNKCHVGVEDETKKKKFDRERRHRVSQPRINTNKGEPRMKFPK